MKQKIQMKLSEAKILIYLSTCSDLERYCRKIAAATRMDYSYCLQMLEGLKSLGWVKMKQYAIKKHFFLTKIAPIDEAYEKVEGEEE